MHFLMFYDYVPDILERRPKFRAAHLSYAWQAQERGELIMGGAYADPVDGAVLLFSGDSPQVAEKFAHLLFGIFSVSQVFRLTLERKINGFLR